MKTRGKCGNNIIFKRALRDVKLPNLLIGLQSAQIQRQAQVSENRNIKDTVSAIGELIL